MTGDLYENIHGITPDKNQYPCIKFSGGNDSLPISDPFTYNCNSREKLLDRTN